MRTRSWVAIVSPAQAQTLLRGGCRRLPVDVSSLAQPRPGDPIAVLAANGPLFVRDSVFVALAEVCGEDGPGLAIRKRVLAPAGHEVRIDELPSLRVTAGWTHGALGGLSGTAVGCTGRDMERIAAALLDRARAFGPAPRRPAHRRPRTPGRRHLLAGRAAVRPRL